MYNSIYPININYRKPSQYRKQNDNEENSAIKNEQQPQQNSFPNGTKVAIDYTKGQINISQVLTDFRSTIIAINAPEDVSEEVNTYLNLVDKESKKENPTREIIVANLKNASRISDAYIAKSLNKPSKVVEGWIDALFLQKINLKADPTEINPAFQLEFSPKAQARIDESRQTKEEIISQPQEEIQEDFQEVSISQIEEAQNIEQSQEIKIEDIYQKIDEVDEVDEIDNIEELTIQEQETTNFTNEPAEIENTLEFSEPKQPIIPKSPFAPVSQSDLEAKELLVLAKNTTNNAQGDTEALNLLNEALGILENSEDLNENIRAAIHLERGKIFDSYDYVDYALRDYFEATKAQDLNLKAQAFFKTGQVYDEFSEFTPAFDNYLSSVAYTGEADNQNAQTIVLSKIASLFTKQFDIDNTKNYSELAINVAQSTQDDELIAQTHSQIAQNFQYLGQNDDAIKSYRNALEIFSRKEESVEEMAYNYEQAAQVMESLGNRAKAEKLRAKANLYYQKSQLFSEQQVKAS